jgi:hypothetical protein
MSIALYWTGWVLPILENLDTFYPNDIIALNCDLAIPKMRRRIAGIRTEKNPPASLDKGKECHLAMIPSAGTEYKFGKGTLWPLKARLTGAVIWRIMLQFLQKPQPPSRKYIQYNCGS